jgi:hypothetical protein
MRSLYVCSSLLLFSSLICPAQREKQLEPLKATFCELYEHPQKYAGKMVEVHAAVYGNRDPTVDQAGPHEPCSAHMTIGLQFPQDVKPKPAFDLQHDESFQKFEDGWRKGMRTIARIQGRFDPVFVWKDHQKVRIGQGDGFGQKHSNDARIVLYRVSDVTAIPLGRK